jgi:endonuclease/exonuclease/phosphatase family metal-dependent hydrolase
VFRFAIVLICLGSAAFPAQAQPRKISVTTLNCYAFFGGGETRRQLGQPETASEFWAKAQNLVNLLPTNAPLLIALQEIGGAREAVYLSQIAARRYGHAFQPVFVETKDTFTQEAVGALVDLSQGWKISGPSGRAPELDKDLSRHLVLRLTNDSSSLDICIVHLKRALGKYGRLEQQDQNRALRKWADAQLAKNPGANIIHLGDFNETRNPGDPEAGLAPLVQPAGLMRDVFTLDGGKFRTHASGKAYDRILISEALEKGGTDWKFQKVSAQPHSQGTGDRKKLFTDHFPVTATFIETPGK